MAPGLRDFTWEDCQVPKDIITKYCLSTNQKYVKQNGALWIKHWWSLSFIALCSIKAVNLATYKNHVNIDLQMFSPNYRLDCMLGRWKDGVDKPHGRPAIMSHMYWFWKKKLLRNKDTPRQHFDIPKFCPIRVIKHLWQGEKL